MKSGSWVGKRGRGFKCNFLRPLFEWGSGTIVQRQLVVNRAPVLTLWAAAVEEVLGFEHDEALTLGRGGGRAERSLHGGSEAGGFPGPGHGRLDIKSGVWDFAGRDREEGRGLLVLI